MAVFECGLLHCPLFYAWLVLQRIPYASLCLACLQAVTGCFYREKPGPFANRAPSWIFKTRGPGDERASASLSTIARPAPPRRVFSKMAAKIANSGFSRRRKTPTPTGRLPCVWGILSCAVDILLGQKFRQASLALVSYAYDTFLSERRKLRHSMLLCT